MNKKEVNGKNVEPITTGSSSGNSVQRLFSTEESIDDECEIDLEDEDEQHKAPLIKGSLKFTKFNHQPLKKKSVKFQCDDKSMDDSIDDDFDLSEHRSKHSINTPPPITIGKIKIFKPNRRHRFLRIRRLIKSCCTIIFCLAFLLFILFNLKNLPHIIRTAFGFHPFSSIISNKDKSIKCDHVVSAPIWRQNFPMLTIESALRLIDVNNDTYLDVIVPFGTGIDAAYYDETLCQIYFNLTESKSKGISCSMINF